MPASDLAPARAWDDDAGLQRLRRPKVGSMTGRRVMEKRNFFAVLFLSDIQLGSACAGRRGLR
jgi:hypothetical protein